MSATAPEVIELAALMAAHNLKIGVVFGRAGLRPQAWSRWKRGVQPRVSEIRAVREAIDALAAERAEG